MIHRLKENKEEEKLIKSIFEEFNEFFNSKINYKDINIFFVSNRDDFNSQVGRKTENWEVAITSNKKGIVFFDRDDFERESCHSYSEEKYNQMLKHEIIHAITFIHFKLYFPNWLVEGIAIYFSGQNSLNQKPNEFKDFISYWDHLDRGIYKESGFAVEILLKKRGKEKFLNLLKSLKENESERFFNEKFKEIGSIE